MSRVPLPLSWLRQVQCVETLSPSTRNFAAVIFTLMDAAGRCWPGVALIAKRMGVSERTAQRAREELVAAGVLKTMVSPGRSNDYQALFPRDVVPSVSPPGVAADTQGVTPMVDAGGTRDTRTTQRTTHENDPVNETAGNGVARLDQDAFSELVQLLPDADDETENVFRATFENRLSPDDVRALSQQIAWRQEADSVPEPPSYAAFAYVRLAVMSGLETV